MNDLDALVERLSLLVDRTAHMPKGAFLWCEQRNDNEPVAQFTPQDVRDTLTALRTQAERIREHEQSLELRHKADMRGIKAWQEANPGNDLKWPSHDDLVTWLIGRVEELEAKLKCECGEELTGYCRFCDNDE